MNYNLAEDHSKLFVVKDLIALEVGCKLGM